MKSEVNGSGTAAYWRIGIGLDAGGIGAYTELLHGGLFPVLRAGRSAYPVALPGGSYQCNRALHFQTGVQSQSIAVGSKLNCPVYVARHLSGFLIEFYMGFSCLRVCGGGG